MKSFLLTLFPVLTLSGGTLYDNGFRDIKHSISSQHKSRDSHYLTISEHSSRPDIQNFQHNSRPDVQYFTSTIKNVNNSLSHISHKLPGLSSMSITRSHPDKKDLYVTRSHPDKKDLYETRNLPDKVETLITRSHKEDQDIVISSMGQAGDPTGYSGRRPIETPGPFSPRFQVGKYEVSDSEWLEEIREGFHDSGLVPGVLPGTPGGLVNINYGPHSCVHMGTELPADRTSSPPSRVSFPASPHQLYSLLMIDVTLERLHWMIINIPGTAVSNGQEVAQYQPPEPLSSSPDGHLYLSVALLQSRVINKRHPSIAKRSSHLCQYGPREQFQVRTLMEEVGMEMVVAANFFTVQHDNYVQSINSYCDKFQ